MVFNGSGELIGVTDRVAADSSYISWLGTLVGDTTDGAYFDDTTVSRWNKWRLNGIMPTAPGTHYAVLLKKKAGSAISQVSPWSGVGSTGTRMLAQDGSTAAGAQYANMSYSAVRKNGVQTVPGNRDELWHDLYDEADTWMVPIMLDVHETTAVGDFHLMSWSSSNTGFQWEGWISGFAEFTDAAQADDVSTALLNTVS